MLLRKQLVLLFSGFFILSSSEAQVSFPVNGIAEPREGCYAFTNATLVKDAQTTITNGTLIIRKGRIIAAAANAVIPKDAVVIDCKDKFIYPSFIDIYSDYGINAPQRGAATDFRSPAQLNTAIKGAYGWNQAVKPETDAFRIFTADNVKAKALRETGFGTAVSHLKDGIARGTSVAVTLADKADNLLILKERAAAHYSLSKGSSTQSYPASVMGSIALLRQTYLDAAWYKARPAEEGVNLSLQAWQASQELPQVFEANEKWNAVRADRIGDEFGIQYIIKGGGDEYQRVKEIAATKAMFIIPMNFPQAMDIEDPADARFVSLADMKHWEMAPANAAALEKAGIPFCLTTSDLRDVKQFTANLRKAMELGLTETRALEALTKTPATLLKIYDTVGSLEPGKLANFLISSGPLFNEKSVLLQNWVQGVKYSVNESSWTDNKGIYELVLESASRKLNYKLEVKSNSNAQVIADDTANARFSFDGKFVKLSFPESRRSKNTIRLSGVSHGQVWSGTGEDSTGNRFLWTAKFIKDIPPVPDTAKKKAPAAIGKVNYPFGSYGWEQLPKQENLLIKNATVWTNEKEGVLQQADVLVKNGKIISVGKNITDASAKQVDGTGKHVTAGIIDEHSHIAAASINEGGQSVSSEVRIADNINPEDVNIYRQLAGGVTSSHILHGSANTIGGQTQLIKLRWGGNDDDLKFKNSDPFIKFALGENVKRTTSTNNNRFPDTRMGVEEVLADAFQRARDYEKAMKLSVTSATSDKKKTAKPAPVRRDLELDALVEILNNKRFITAHSYIQSEITALLRVADKYGFKVNTFTHILEGYKVADKMKEHGSAASTFSDWWAYKMEVQDAIPYNASIMQRVGLNVCINSDDAEMARRLNQEAAKSVKYGGMPEEEALKMVTINPAKALHVEDRVGSIKVGKDADLVIWSDHPLSIYAKAEKTIVDGIIYFDREKDLQVRNQIAAERNRLIQKMLGEKKSGAPVQPAQPSYEILLTCGDHEHKEGLITIDGDEGIH
jgi:imidazolonepropionase-like amidohydrolase